MRNAEIVVFPMRLENINTVAEIHRNSFPDSRSTRLGRPFLRKMYEWYIRYQPQLSFVAVLDDQVIGFVTGTYGWGGAQRRFRYTCWHIVWGFLRTPTLLLSAEMFEAGPNFLRGLRLKQQNAPIVRQEVDLGGIANSNRPISIKIALDSIAVHPVARGRDVGVALIETFEQSAHRLGGSYLSLGVEADNHPARRLYEKCGWSVVYENVENNSVGYRKMLLGN
jgi:ribosomal protein S18 acetylase RimI-like enzyme